MKIGIDAFFFHSPFNGVGQVTAHFLKVLGEFSLPDFMLRHGLKPFPGECEFFLYMGSPSVRDWPRHLHPRVLPLRGNGVLDKKWWEMRTLPAAVRSDGCDAFISLYQAATVMPRSFAHVMVVHDVIYAIFPEYRRRLSWRLSLPLSLRGIRRASHCVAVSHYTKQDMIRHLGMPAESISVAYVGADSQFLLLADEENVSSVLQQYGLERGYIYHGGGNNWRKNVEGILRAYAQLACEMDGIAPRFVLPPLVISGTFPSGATGVVDVAALSQSLGIAGQVKVVGMVPQENLPALYRGASMFLFPSYYEGFGLPVLEAMHQGTPVITSNTSSLPEVGGDAVLYCNPKEPAELAAAIRRLLGDETLRKSLSASGRLRASAFSGEGFFDELMARTLKLARPAR